MPRNYRAFEAAITAEYDVESAVERELVLRFVSLPWRLRRATTIETGLIDIQVDDVCNFEKPRQVRRNSSMPCLVRRAQSTERMNQHHRSPPAD